MVSGSILRKSLKGPYFTFLCVLTSPQRIHLPLSLLNCTCSSCVMAWPASSKLRSMTRTFCVLEDPLRDGVTDPVLRRLLAASPPPPDPVLWLMVDGRRELDAMVALSSAADRRDMAVCPVRLDNPVDMERRDVNRPHGRLLLLVVSVSSVFSSSVLQQSNENASSNDSSSMAAIFAATTAAADLGAMQAVPGAEAAAAAPPKRTPDERRALGDSSLP
mmetsp:Transcript_4500/g.6835  ORF Transcript_4500/g.6835 Transcript_4500/m.6835 type:complete len:218 (+) Transcript_4500:1825-2478(+)